MRIITKKQMEELADFIRSRAQQVDGQMVMPDGSPVQTFAAFRSFCNKQFAEKASEGASLERHEFMNCLFGLFAIIAHAYEVDLKDAECWKPCLDLFMMGSHATVALIKESEYIP